MGYRVPLLKGLRNPYIISQQIRQAERLRGLWESVILLILSCVFLYGLSAFLGIGSETVSKKLAELPKTEYEAHKMLFAAGQVGWGLFISLVILFLASLPVWTLTDVEYRKLVAVQLFVLMIFFIEKGISIPVNLFLGLSRESNLFSLGIIAQILTANKFLVCLFSSITLFHAWAFVIQYKYLKVMSDKSPLYLVIVLGLLYLFAILMSALLSFMEIENILL